MGQHFGPRLEINMGQHFGPVRSQTSEHITFPSRSISISKICPISIPSHFPYSQRTSNLGQKYLFFVSIYGCRYVNTVLNAVNDPIND